MANDMHMYMCSYSYLGNYIYRALNTYLPIIYTTYSLISPTRRSIKAYPSTIVTHIYADIDIDIDAIARYLTTGGN